MKQSSIAKIYVLASVFALVAAGVFALMIRTQLIGNSKESFSASFYNQAFTLHGMIMVFLFIIPAIPSFIGSFFKKSKNEVNADTNLTEKQKFELDESVNQKNNQLD